MNVCPRVLREHPATSVLVICLLAIALLVVRNLLQPQQDARLMSIRQAGYPVTLAELNTFYPAVPEDQNAALVYQKAFESALFTNAVVDDLIKDSELGRGEPLPQEVQAALAALLATNSHALELLYSATNLCASRYPLDFRDGHMVLLPHLAKMKRTTTLLLLDGLGHASAQDASGAYAGFNAAFHATDSLREEPTLISFLVRIACSSLVAKRLEQALNLVNFQELQLRDLQARFAAAEDPRWSARALAGERAFGLSFFIDRRIQQSITKPQQGIGSMPSGLGGQLVLAGYRASGLMAKDQDFYVTTMAKSVALAELPADQRIASGPPPSMSTSNRFLIFSRMMLPALQRVLDRADEHAARMRVAQTALAVERFRLAHAGAAPDALGRLAPQYLSAIPLDPFDSQPLRYKKLPQGFVVYSIGPDKQDDGGAEPPPDTKRKASRSAPKDLTFIVERK